MTEIGQNLEIFLSIINTFDNLQWKLIQSNQMQTKDKIQEAGTSLVTAFLNKVKPLYVFCAVLPLIFIYPKPLIYILKPIIRNWSFHYRKINSVTNKPTQIILASNPNICFSKEQIKKLTVVKGILPQAFRLIRESIIDQEELRQNQDQLMKHVLIKKKYEFQKERLFGSCYVIDMQDNYLLKGQNRNLIHSQSLNERKNSHTEVTIDESKQTSQSIYSEIDYMWVEMILMKLKILQLENSSEAIKHVIIKANERVLQLLQAKILGIKENEAFKLGIIGQNKIHLLKLNKTLKTYEQCSATFKIQQKTNSTQQ